MKARTTTADRAGWMIRMLKATFLAAVLAWAMIAALPAAKAQGLWAEREAVVAELAKSYAEAPVALGVTEGGAVMELFTTENGATWTLVITLPNGFSRIVAAGEEWTSLPPVPEGPTS